MGPRRNANDCFFYYRGYCYKGNRCSYRHEPRALGSQVICKHWQRHRCYIPNCPQRHSSFKNSDPRIWEDRLGRTPFLKSRYFLQHPRPQVGDEECWIRNVYLDSSTFSIRKRKLYKVGNQQWYHGEESSTRENIKITLRRNTFSVVTSSQDNRFVIHRGPLRHTPHENRRLPRIGALRNSLNTKVVQQGVGREGNCSSRASSNNSVSNTSIINMRFAKQNDTVYDTELSNIERNAIRLTPEWDSEGGSHRHMAIENSGIVTKELFSHSTPNTVSKHTVRPNDPLGLLTFMMTNQEQKRNSHLRLHVGHLEFEDSVGNNLNKNSSSGHPKWNIGEPVREQENNWSDNASDVSGNAKLAEKQQRTWHTPSTTDECEDDSSPSSVIIHKESNVSPVHQGSGYNATYGTEDCTHFCVQLPKNPTDYTSFANRNCSMPTVENADNGETGTMLPKHLRDDGFRRRSHSVYQQPIPRIRLKRSRSAGSKETWKIHSPRSKASKYSHELENNSVYNPQNYLALPQNVNLQAGIASSNVLTIAEQMFHETSGSDLTEDPPHPMQYRSRSRTRNTSSVSV